jgi:hypothetical protein
MAVTYNVAAKTARMTATRDYFANGTLEILTAADALIVAFGLNASGGTVSGAAWTLVFDANTVPATAGGTANKAQIKNASSAAHLTGLTVGTSGTDVILDNLVIATSQNVTLSSAVITHAT